MPLTVSAICHDGVCGMKNKIKSKLTSSFLFIETAFCNEQLKLFGKIVCISFISMADLQNGKPQVSREDSIQESTCSGHTCVVPAQLSYIRDNFEPMSPYYMHAEVLQVVWMQCWRLQYIEQDQGNTYVNSPGTARIASDPMATIWTSTISGCHGWGRAIWCEKKRSMTVVG